jgi:two-component system cell cycle sensor histidine kinase/response regulator CckA
VQRFGCTKDAMVRPKTARSKTEKHRHELFGVVSRSDGAVIGTDLAGIVVSWSQGAQDLYGYAAREMIGEPVTRIIPEHLHEESLQLMRDIAAGQSLGRCETIRRRRSGGLVHVSLIVAPIRSLKGQIIGYSTIAHDLTDHKRGEECERLAAVVESSDDAIIGQSLDGTIFAWNSGAVRLFGYSVSEALGKPIQMLLPPERTNEESDILARIRNGEHVNHFETVRVRKDGGRVDVSVAISPIRDKSGTIVGASKIARDITERRLGEEVRERLAAVVESSEDAIIGKNPDGTIFAWNSGAVRLFGYSVSEALGKPIQMLVPPERANEEADILARIQNGERVDHFETVRLRKDCTKVHVSVTISPIRDRSGAIIGASKVARDITERKRREEEFVRSQRDLEDKTLMLQSVLDSMSEGLIATDATGKFVLSNPAAEAIVCLGALDSPSKGWSEQYGLFLPDKVTPLPLEQNPTARAIRGEASTAVMFLRYPALAEGGFVEASASPLRDKHGVVRGGVTAFRDITERMRSEERLREYERVVEGLADMIVVVDKAHRYVIANRAFLDFRNIKREQVIGRRVDEVLEKETYDSIVKEKMDECFRGRVVHYELRYTHQRLGARALFASYFPIAGPTGIERIACVLRDITERKQAEDELRKSEERFSKVFRQSPLAITISTELEGRYLDANESFLKMAGYTRADVVGQTASDLAFWVVPSLSTDLLHQLREGARVMDHRVQYKTSMGEIRDAELSWEQLEVDGQPCLLAFMRDITEAERLEAQFLQAQKMEAVGRLAGGVAHDFNNMLSVIIGYSDLSVDLLALEGPAKRYVMQIKKAAERAALLTRQLLAFSRQEIVFPRILDLNDVVSNLATMLRRMVGESVSVSFRPTTPLGCIKADPGQIEQILMNLVVNARDAMSGGGEIVITTGHADLDEHYVSEHAGSQVGPHVYLATGDTGCGIDENIRSKIFEPFFTTKGIGQGTGLGLSTVYGIVAQSNGSVCVDSEAGKGATFTIYFPRIAAKAEGLVQSPEVDDVISGAETILLVEDDDSVRNVTANLLSTAGYRIIEASNALKALEIMTAPGPEIDLLLTDLIMFGQSGFNLFEKAKAIRPDLRALFMSGYTGDLVALRGGVISERAFLSKPFTRISLLKKVYSALHSE